MARVVEHELEREALADYLDTLDRQFGPVPASLVEQYDALWPS